MQNLFGPRSTAGDFFTWFEEAATNNLSAARLLDELCQHFEQPQQMAERIHDLEHTGDDISHRIYQQLNRVFMPPLDREDIIELTHALDDVLDYIDSAADAMYVYNIQQPTAEAQELARIIVSCAEEIARHLPDLRKRGTMARLQEGVVELNRLENLADDVLRRGLIDLFHTPHDAREIMAWSRIYEMMEEVTDKSEDIADVLRGLMIKNG